MLAFRHASCYEAAKPRKRLPLPESQCIGLLSTLAGDTRVADRFRVTVSATPPAEGTCRSEGDVN
ncbi:hypothetical protein CTA1_9516 [Colletotrichum tanaceti]|uniref:Uncharacterized protein n=1 Tax=Colletotrichum tanaceti TaxID=1306861 RepID=A0A4U6XJ39_9PEZI|nr:hypothetical protein CTA1_9516 [Colletotrichum tanaceti]